MHGLPLALATFERKRIDGIPSMAMSGQWAELQLSYIADSPPNYTFRFGLPGWYLLLMQADTGRTTTEIELLDGTAETVNALGRWLMTTFPQCNSITVGVPGTGDPSYTELTRQWQPFERVSIPYLIKIDSADTSIRVRVDSGLSFQTWQAFIWRFQDFTQPQTQQACCTRFDPTPSGAVTSTRLPAKSDPLCYNDYYRYRIVVSSTSASNTITWAFSNLATTLSNDLVLGNYTYQLVVKVQKSPGITTGSGSLVCKTRSRASVLLDNQTILYDTSLAVYTVDFAARPTDAIGSIELSGFTNGDRFDVEVQLNVTN